MNVKPPTHPANEPYCSNCGYLLKSLTESSKCPECGRPIVEVLTRNSRFLELGKRYRSKTTLCGLPVIDIALGPKNGELRGHARGIIAIGDEAMGWIAIGGMARGIVTVGGLAIGVVSIGGGAIGLLGALGGAAAGGMAIGGGAAGVIATGGGAAGLIAQGGGAVGMFIRDAQSRKTPAPPIFDRLGWLLGDWPATPVTVLQPVLWFLFVAGFVSAIIGAIAWWKMRDEWNTDQPA